MSPPPELTLTVTDPGAAAFLVNPESRRFLAPFLDRDCTVTAAARELGEAPNSVLYRVRRMVKLGLLVVVRQEARRGRPVRVYRSVAGRLFVPYTATPAVDLLESLTRERAASEAVLQRAVLRVMRQVRGEEDWGLLLYRRGQSLLEYDAVGPDEPWHPLNPGDPAVLDHTVTLRSLTREQAKALQLELLDVLRRHSRGPAQPAPEAVPYLLRLALAPLTQEDT